MLLAAGLGLSLLTLALIATETLAETHLLWIAYGTFSTFGTLVYSQAAAGFPVGLSVGSNTALNLMVFIRAFGVQWGLGVLIDWLQAQGQNLAAAHRSAFLVLFAIQFAAYAWFQISSRRSQ